MNVWAIITFLHFDQAEKEEEKKEVKTLNSHYWPTEAH